MSSGIVLAGKSGLETTTKGVAPIEATGARTAKLIPDAKYHVIKDGPHGCNWTHATEFNEALLKFLEGK